MTTQNDSPVNLLLLFPKTPFGINIPDRRGECLARIEGVLGCDIANRAHLVTSEDHFQATFTTYGDWESWIWNTVYGKNYVTRSALFTGFIVMTTSFDRCGKATASIANLALKAGRVVLHDNGHELKSVLSIEAPEANPSWVDGWIVSSKAI